MKRGTKYDADAACVEDDVAGEMDEVLVANWAEKAQRFTTNDARRARQNEPALSRSQIPQQ